MKYIFPKLYKIERYLKITYFEKYINDCKNKKNYRNSKENNKSNNKSKLPFLSVCICSHNSEKFIEYAILSILNQSFQNFEVIIIDDFSNDDSYNILKKYENIDNRFRIINHEKNYGIYRSRVDAIYNSKGKYILFVDSDDMILNEYLFEILFYYSSFYNFDIIEYLVLHQVFNKKKLVFPSTQTLSHIHNYSKSFVYQPELSTIIFYIPRTKIYSSVICRTVWNKLYKKKIILKSINYIGEKFYLKSYLSYGEDTILNILNFHYAQNYTNINIHGYLYNIRYNSVSRFSDDIEKRRIINLGIYYYIKLFYKYISEFNISRELLFHEFELFNKLDKNIFFLKMKDPLFFNKKMKKIFFSILNDDDASEHLKLYIKNLIEY